MGYDLLLVWYLLGDAARVVDWIVGHAISGGIVIEVFGGLCRTA